LSYVTTDYFQIRQRLESKALGLVDLRSPSEFNQGSMPFAVNIPLFKDPERAEVGTIYKRQGSRNAIERGLEIVAANIDSFIDQLSAQVSQDRQLAIHCWRGGMRSHAVAELLRSIGVKPILIQGGYKSYRRQVLELIMKMSSHSLLVLNGRTGTGKTRMLRELMASGIPGIDLEAIASHRGSALGDFNMNSPQPSQQNFENQLATKFEAVQFSPVILLEIEQDIGSVRMPQDLRRQIYSSPMILLERCLEDRITHLEREYVEGWDEARDQLFAERMLLLKKHLQGPVFEAIQSHIRKKQFKDAIKLLLLNRYDRCYDKAILRQNRQIIETIDVSSDWTSARDRVASLFRSAAAWSPHDV
jgi:tRNA 2-selenouridine synthase